MSGGEFATILVALGLQGPKRKSGMKEYVVEAPLSAEAAALLKDPPAARDLLIRILEGGDRRHFQVKTGDRVLEVSSSYPLTADADH